MKNLALILLFMFTTNYIFAQNLVPNFSFEQYSTCPSSTFEIDKATSWTSGGGSPDYYNACAIPGGVSVPDNIYGFQYAASGNAYVGLFTYNKGVSWPGHREHIQTNLITPLVIGTKYYISMDISFTIDAFEVGFASDKLGMLFTNVSTYDANNPPLSNNNSQVFIDTIISDTINWYHFEASFVADSSYQKLLIGNFFDDNNTDTLILDTSLFTAYYYIDNICVSSDSNDCLVSTGVEKNNIDEDILLFPNPVNKDYIWLEIKNQSKTDNWKYQIYNAIGDIIQTNYKPLEKGKTKIDLSVMSKGLYFIEVYHNSKTLTKKFIIN